MKPTLAYQTAEMQIHREPDGSLQIDIPPRDWRRILKIKTTGSLVVGIIFVVVGMAVPPAMIFFLTRDRAEAVALLIAVPLFEVIIVLIAMAAIDGIARKSIHIRATSTSLLIEVFGKFDSTRLHLQRDEIEYLDAHADAESPTMVQMRLRRRRYDTSDSFLGHLSEEEVRKIVALLQATLKLPAVPPFAKS